MDRCLALAAVMLCFSPLRGGEPTTVEITYSAVFPPEPIRGEIQSLTIEIKGGKGLLSLNKVGEAVLQMPLPMLTTENIGINGLGGVTGSGNVIFRRLDYSSAVLDESFSVKTKDGILTLRFIDGYANPVARPLLKSLRQTIVSSVALPGHVSDELQRALNRNDLSDENDAKKVEHSPPSPPPK